LTARKPGKEDEPGYPHFTTCAGGTATNGGDFQRSSDPWVTFAPNGDTYFIGLTGRRGADRLLAATVRAA
jgi:hypothetical protein